MALAADGDLLEVRVALEAAQREARSLAVAVDVITDGAREKYDLLVEQDAKLAKLEAQIVEARGEADSHV